ncbi:hypothetical protein V6N13_091767 [Hibiscus sabdariffa]
MYWTGSSNGSYSSQIYCEKLSTIGSIADKVWRTVWTGLAPPKVEGLLWKAVPGRIPTLDELAKRGIHRTETNLCAFCSKESETVQHLFCHCEVVWMAWSKWVKLWHNQLVVPSNIYQFTLMWDCLTYPP